MRERLGQQRVRRRITRSSLWTTRKSGSDIVRASVSVWRYSGQERADSITLPSQEPQVESSEALLTESHSTLPNQVVTPLSKSSEDLDIYKSIEGMRIVLAELYNSIGYTAGIKALGLDIEEESDIR